LSEGLVVQAVRPGSIAAELELAPGDRIIAINGVVLEDLIDYRFYSTDERLNVLVAKKDGEQWLLEIDKEDGEDLGLSFAAPFPKMNRCRNRCLFCFVDQMRPGLRSSLYIKDDDYRLSFLEGNFITLTNVDERDLRRIAGQRLSPLYVSVHTTNPALRRRLMGHRRAGGIMGQLRLLKAAGIEVHTQVVLCPGLNDGDELSRTVKDLATLWPSVQSVGVVPVGRTRYRDGLYPLSAFTVPGARALVAAVAAWQGQYRKRYGKSFVYAADEFYLLAGCDVPPAEAYDGFVQLENGIGMVRLFLDEWSAVEPGLPDRVPPRRVTVVSGRLAGALVEPLVKRLNRVDGLEVRLAVINNEFLGQTVTVSGLLSGGDIAEQLAGGPPADLVVVPGSALKDGHTFLDDITTAELGRHLGAPVVGASGPRELVSLIIREYRSFDRGHERRSVNRKTQGGTGL